MINLFLLIIVVLFSICGLLIAIMTSFIIVRAWFKFRDTFLLHLAFLAVAVAVSLCLMTLMMIYLDNSDIALKPYHFFWIGVVYELFYLEVSFFYLSLFPNSHALIEKYIPFIIGGSVIWVVINGVSSMTNYLTYSMISHVIVLIIGLFLVARIFFKLKDSEIYFNKPYEKELIQFLERIVLLALFILFCDGLGFLTMNYYDFTSLPMLEAFLFFSSVMQLVFGLLALWIVKTIQKKVKKVDITVFLNNIS